jgi:hypothetical protein
MIELASTVDAVAPALLDMPELPVLEVPDGVPDVAGDEVEGEVDGADGLEGEDVEGELEVPDELEESDVPGWVPAPVVDC